MAGGSNPAQNTLPCYAHMIFTDCLMTHLETIWYYQADDHEVVLTDPEYMKPYLTGCGRKGGESLRYSTSGTVVFST